MRTSPKEIVDDTIKGAEPVLKMFVEREAAKVLLKANDRGL